MGEIKSKKKKINTNKRIKLFRSKNATTLSFPGGKIAYNIFDPSSGGIGTRLKTINKILAYTIIYKNSVKAEIGKNLISMAKAKAKEKLDKGPATATKAGPHF